MKASCLHILAAILFMLSACNTIPRYNLYVPNTVHTPLIKEAGDYNVTGCFGLVGGFQGQASFSPGNNFIVFANGMDNLLAPKHDTNSAHALNFETGFGIYFNLYQKNLTVHQLNIIGGYGQGFCFDKYNVYANQFYNGQANPIYYQQLQATYERYFFQPSYDIIKPHSTTSFSLKISGNAIDVTTSGAYVPHSKLNGASSYNLSTIEFAMTKQRRYRYISTYFQYKVFIPLNSDEYDKLVTKNGTNFAQAILSFTFGLTLNSYNVLKLRHPPVRTTNAQPVY